MNDNPSIISNLHHHRDASTRPAHLCCSNCDVLSKVFEFLSFSQIISCRRVSSEWKDAVSKTMIEEEYVVNESNNNTLMSQLESAVRYCLMGSQFKRIRFDRPPKKADQAICTQQQQQSCDKFETLILKNSFPNLKELTFRYWDGKESFLPLEMMANSPSDGITTTAFHRNNDKYIFFQFLTHLNLHGNTDMVWTLLSLNRFPQLTNLQCVNNAKLMGDIKDISIEHPNCHNFVVIDVSGCTLVTGNLLDLRRLPKLERMGLARTKVGGDLRDVQGENDFPSLQISGLNHSIYGASQFDNVQDAHAVMITRHRWMTQSTEEIPIFPFKVRLSYSSPQYHERIEQRLYSSERDPPFNIEYVKVGNRHGWRWSNYLGGFCKVHWLDPPPLLPSTTTAAAADAIIGLEYSTYKKELAALHREEESSLFSNFLDPPTPEEYHACCLLQDEIKKRASSLRNNDQDNSTIDPPSSTSWNLHKEATIPDL